MMPLSYVVPGALCLCGILLALFLVDRLLRLLLPPAPPRLPVRDVSKGHQWSLVRCFPPGVYCNACTQSALDGAQCDLCGAVAHGRCVRKTDRRMRCRVVSAADESPSSPPPSPISESSVVPSKTKHHWVPGNLPMFSTCAACSEPCGEGVGIRDQRCAWCQRTVHDDKKCIDTLSRICDLGPLRRMIVPPECVRLVRTGWHARRQLVIESVARPPIARWQPVIVLANRKSGSGEGEAALTAFRRLLNPAQVVDVSKVRPELGLKWCALLPQGVRCRVLVCGGDGTVGWVLGALEDLQLDESRRPMVALLPLGTGNDLSRVLGWGSGHTGPVDAMAALRAVHHARPMQLDRWSVSIKHARHFGLRPADRLARMSNYMSLGVDAAVTLNFHNTRETLPRALSSRFINKMLFFHYGTRDVVERACKNLTDCVSLSLDGRPTQLPALEGVVVLNVPSWGAGVRPWDMGDFRWTCGNDSDDDADQLHEQRIDDGKLEVIGLYSSFHIAQLQVGIGEPYRIGQASEVTITVRGRPVPMQVDGEPWKQPPATITINRLGQVTMLRPDSEHKESEDQTAGAYQNLLCGAESSAEVARFF